ncbi:MAG: DNA-binding domain-containing protein [Legionella sp.]|nr:DNA-binding domain-containing protein [Legionella sp.]
MTELLNLQNQFQEFLLSGQCAIHDSIVETELVPVETRLAIYRDAYVLRLIECLNANFPFLSAYLGTDEFNQLARAYIAQHPSSYRSIRWFGDGLADFVSNYYPQYPHLAELTAFEWKMTLAFDAAEAQRVQIEDMAAVPPYAWADLHFVLHPSVHLLSYFWNAIPLWQALAHDEALPDLQKNTEANTWVLWRSEEYLIQFYSLSKEEAWALDTLAQGRTFADLCEGLCEWLPEAEVGMRAASYLKNWIQKGILSKLVSADKKLNNNPID